MSRLTLTPAQLPRTGANAPLNLTSLLTAGVLGSNTGVSWSNTGREVLAVQVGAAASTCTVNIGTTIEGQTVAPLTPTLATTSINVIGPFPTDIEDSAGHVTVDFGTPANILGVVLLQNVGVL